MTALNCSVVIAFLTLPVSLSTLSMSPSLMMPADATHALICPNLSIARSMRLATCSSLVTLVFA